MPVSSEPAKETYPVTDIEVDFGSGQKYACTLKDGIDRLTATETGWTIEFASPQERCELYRAHVAMIRVRERLHERWVAPPAQSARNPTYGR